MTINSFIVPETIVGMMLSMDADPSSHTWPKLHRQSNNNNSNTYRGMPSFSPDHMSVVCSSSDEESDIELDDETVPCLPFITNPRKISIASSIVTKRRKVLVIVVRADPIICGHSTEARNIAEAALARGYEPFIITWAEELLENSGLPLKPADQIEPYSHGIRVLRPSAIGNYKLLDGRYNFGMTSAIVELARSDPDMELTVMCLYLQPHASIVLDAVRGIRGAFGKQFDVTTVAEAVGSDVTNVLCNALRDSNYGAAITVLSDFLSFDVPVCVSEFTRSEILRHAAEVDDAIGTNFASQIAEKASISYPALRCSDYTDIDESVSAGILANRGLLPGRYVLYLSRVIEAKGVFEMVKGFNDSSLPSVGYELVIVGRGEALAEVQAVTAGMRSVRHITDMADYEKASIMRGAAVYVLASKFHPTFVETFGIVVVEAMLSGTPVITCRTGGIPEATGGHCVYATPGDENKEGPCFDACANSLRECLEHVCLRMTDAERNVMITAALKYSLQFDRDCVFKRLEAQADAVRKDKMKQEMGDFVKDDF